MRTHEYNHGIGSRTITVSATRLPCEWLSVEFLGYRGVVVSNSLTNRERRRAIRQALRARGRGPTRSRMLTGQSRQRYLAQKAT
ncbi:MAG: hypothetical protein JWM95_4202 [Gemmatimonadetes bacterium]|nr:hypothetical protein [Gemmatimonadota bacterium]